jgi:hypothetical protein
MCFLVPSTIPRLGTRAPVSLSCSHDFVWLRLQKFALHVSEWQQLHLPTSAANVALKERVSHLFVLVALKSLQLNEVACVDSVRHAVRYLR